MAAAVRILSVVVLVFASRTLWAALALPNLISEHAVFQREKPIPVWGTAEPGAKVVVTFADKPETTTVDADGRWRVKFDAMEAGGPFTLTVQSGAETIEFKDILVGDVWFCSGQSNMRWPFGEMGNYGQEGLKDADRPRIRLMRGCHQYHEKVLLPEEDAPSPWQRCNADSLRSFSGVAFYFADTLQKSIDVPVGLIYAMAIEPATGVSPVAFEAHKDELISKNEFHMNVRLQRFLKTKAEAETLIAKYRADLAAWKQGGTGNKPQLADYEKQASDFFAFGGDFLHNVAPFTQVPIKGMIYYQGETGNKTNYDRWLALMIQDWRRQWQQEGLPCILVQLPLIITNLRDPAVYPATGQRLGGPEWALTRETQWKVSQTLPNVAYASILEFGEPENIHPPNKKPAGERIALAALNRFYGKDVAYIGPVFDRMKVEANKVRISFKHLGKGLMTKGGGPPAGFQIAGQDKKFCWANAEIDGETILVWSDKVAEPVAVRYAFWSNPVFNLYNQDGLPAVPFRTDDWDPLQWH